MEYWRPISTAPRDGTPVWLFVDGQQTEAWYASLEGSHWDGPNGYDDDYSGSEWICADATWTIQVEEYIENGKIRYFDGKATHWMPLKEKPSNILCIVGLPGSGKTYTACQYLDKSYIVVLDDISNIDDLPIKKFNLLIITDPNFCITSVRESAEKILIEKYNSQPEWIFFENNKDKCLVNVKYRNDGRNVEDYINAVSQVYEIPEGYDAIEIWQPS